MKRFTILLMLMVSVICGIAQQQEEPFSYVENMPVFPGGKDAMLMYIQTQLVYPSEAHQERITGVVKVQFVVNPDGSTSRATVVNGPGYGCDEEAVRVIDAMNQEHVWTPGSHNGRVVPVIISVPVKFQIPQGEQKKPRKQRGYGVRHG